MVHDGRIDDALARRWRPPELEHEQRREIEECRHQITAWCGFSTRVETTVAMEFAASWNPFMKSNASATSTSNDDDSQADLDGFHRGRATYECSSTMPSTMFATSSQRSVISSSSS